MSKNDVEPQYAWLVEWYDHPINQVNPTIRRVEVIRKTAKSITYKDHGGTTNIRSQYAAYDSKEEAVAYWNELADIDMTRRKKAYEEAINRRIQGPRIEGVPAERPEYMDQPLILE